MITERPGGQASHGPLPAGHHSLAVIDARLREATTGRAANPGSAWYAARVDQLLDERSGPARLIRHNQEQP